MCPAMQVLYSEEGYTYLDVRPKLEYEEVGRVKGSVNIPLVNLRRVWDPEQKKKVIHKEDNENFTEQVSPPSLLGLGLPVGGVTECCQEGRRLKCLAAAVSG